MSEAYNLDAIAQHNAEHDNDYGVYDDFDYRPPTPSSDPQSDGVHTRSGRSTRRTDSPFSMAKSRISKSPSAKPKKEKKSKVNKTSTPPITAPLSVLTKDISVPVKDIHGWVHRSSEVRRQEAEKRGGYVTRPMNSFMLYRSAYADRTKKWCLQNNHQVVSRVAGESWPMEPDEVRDQFNEWSRIERANHAAAHPGYKFSPTKPANKRRRGDFSDDEGEASELELDPDGDYRAGRNVRPRHQAPIVETNYLNTTVGFESHPYFSQQQAPYEIPQFHPQYAHVTRPLPSSGSYDQAQYYYNNTTNNHYSQDSRRAPTPQSSTQQSVGGYGLPGGQHVGADELFSSSRTSTPNQRYQFTNSAMYMQYNTATPSYPSQQAYEHQQYLQAQSHPQAGIDPTLETGFADLSESEHVGHESHFDNAMHNMGGPEFSQEYYQESTSPNTTLGPAWSPAEMMR